MTIYEKVMLFLTLVLIALGVATLVVGGPIEDHPVECEVYDECAKPAAERCERHESSGTE